MLLAQVPLVCRLKPHRLTVVGCAVVGTVVGVEVGGFVGLLVGVEVGAFVVGVFEVGVPMCVTGEDNVASEEG